MDKPVMSIQQEVQSKPVVLISQPVGKAALAALSVAAAGLALGLSSTAMANTNSSAPQPVALMAQQGQVTAGTEKLQVWEKTLQERLGIDRANMRKSTGTGCTTCCPDADDCGQD